MVKAIQVAQWFVHRAAMDANAKSGDYMTQLRVQKLLFFAQAVYLVEHDGKPLFGEDIIHLQYGPVVISLMNYLKKYSYGLIEDIEGVEINFGDQKDEVEETLERVYKAFGQFSTNQLVFMTHKDPAWLNTENKKVITHKAIYASAKKLYFE